MLTKFVQGKVQAITSSVAGDRRVYDFTLSATERKSKRSPHGNNTATNDAIFEGVNNFPQLTRSVCVCQLALPVFTENVNIVYVEFWTYSFKTLADDTISGTLPENNSFTVIDITASFRLWRNLSFT